MLTQTEQLLRESLTSFSVHAHERRAPPTREAYRKSSYSEKCQRPEGSVAAESTRPVFLVSALTKDLGAAEGIMRKEKGKCAALALGDAAQRLGL